MATGGPSVFSLRAQHKHVYDVAATLNLVTPLPCMEIACADLSLILYHPHVLLLSFSVRAVTVTLFVKLRASASCRF